MNMRLYYIAYDYGIYGMEMIDGPYGTASEAHQERLALLRFGEEDDKLVVVRIIEQIEKVDI